MADDNEQQIVSEFDENVNMSARQLEDWLKTDKSQSVGQSDGGESKGHESGRRIVELLRKNKSDYTDDDLSHMKKVNSYVKRHLGQKPKSDVEDSKWRYSLMNKAQVAHRKDEGRKRAKPVLCWGHDPLK